MYAQSLNSFILTHVRTIEMVGVLMRIFGLSLVSWLRQASPVLFVGVVGITRACRSCTDRAVSCRCRRSFLAEHQYAEVGLQGK